jgi:hypothetical protein
VNRHPLVLSILEPPQLPAERYGLRIVSAGLTASAQSGAAFAGTSIGSASLLTANLHFAMIFSLITQ